MLAKWRVLWEMEINFVTRSTWVDTGSLYLVKSYGIERGCQVFDGLELFDHYFRSTTECDFQRKEPLRLLLR